MPIRSAIFSIEEPQPFAGKWLGALVFPPERDLALIEVLELQSAFGEAAWKIGGLRYLVLTPRYQEDDFCSANKFEKRMVVAVYSIIPSRVDELRGMRMNDAISSGILNEALGIGDFIVQ